MNLVLYILATKYSKYPIIIAGDFNYPYKTIKKYKYYKRFNKYPPEDVYKYFLQYFIDSDNYDLQKRITNFNTWSATDFIFINKQFNNLYKNFGYIKKINISDHYPVYMDFIEK